MPITQEEIGRRLREAREALGMTQEDVASALGLSRPSVAQIELGGRSVSSLELSRLAEIFGRDMRQFVAVSFEPTDSLTALFRAQPEATRQPAVVRALRECVNLGREIRHLERELGVDLHRPAPAIRNLPAPRGRWEAVEQGEAVAGEERVRLALGAAPVPRIEEILEEQGVRAALARLPEDISGLTLVDPEAGVLVVARESEHLWRRRYSLAHEYAHVLLDRDRAGVISRRSEREDLVEVRANSFAAAFLMPEAGFVEFLTRLGKGRSSRSVDHVFDGEAVISVEGRAAPGSQELQLYEVVQLAHRFRVSVTAALYRLLNLRLITQPAFDRLSGQAANDGAKAVAHQLGLEEPHHRAEREGFRRRYLALALEAYRRERISRGKLVELARLLGVEDREINVLLDDLGLGPEDEGHDARQPRKGP